MADSLGRGGQVPSGDITKSLFSGDTLSETWRRLNELRPILVFDVCDWLPTREG